MNIHRLAKWSGPLLVLPFAAVVCGALGRTVPDAVDVPFAPSSRDVGTRLMLLPALTSQSGLVTRQLEFTVGDRQALSELDQLRIAIDGYGITTRMLDAHLDLDGTTCSYRSPARTLDFGTVLTLTKNTACVTGPGRGRARLTAVLAGRRPASTRVGAWMAPVAAGETPLITTDDREPRTPVGHATRIRSTDRVRASALIAWMWNVRERTVWSYVAAGVLLILLGAVLSMQSANVIAAASAALSLAFGIALLYVIAVPPLQAPDETDHLLSFAKLTGRTSMPAAEEAWARRVHFDRIAFRRAERFTPADRDMPWSRAWDPADVFAEDVAHRSTTAARFWQTLARILPADPAQALLRIRTADAAVFAVAIAAGVAVLDVSGASAAVTLGLVLLAIPALPFFAMQMSEITWSIAAFLLIGFACASLLAGSGNILNGLALGAAAALLAAGTRAGWPTAATIAAAALAHIVARPPQTDRRGLFWAGLVLPTVILFGTRLLHVPAPSYNQWHLGGLDPRFPVHSEWVIGAILVLGGIGYASDLGWSAVMRRRGGVPPPVSLIAAGLCVWIAATLVLSMFVQLPSMPTLETPTEMPLPHYLARLLACIVTTPRAAGADFFAWTTFLSGFGWLDTFLSERLQALVTVIGAAAAIWLLTSIAIERDGRRGAIVAIVTMGAVVTIIGCGVGAYGLNRTLHGRYLLGPYLAVIGLLCAGPAVLPARRVPLFARTFVLLTIVLSIHAAALWVIASRYFW